MKLLKLSLATAVAAGALASVASATPLEQAIKDVDVTGFARYRYDSTTENESGTDKQHKASHRFTSDVDFKATLDDNFFGVIGVRYDNKDVSGDHINGGVSSVKSGSVDSDGYSSNSEFNVRQIYLGYTAGNTIIQAGRQVLGTFFTDDMVGTGLKILNQDIKGLTLAAIAFDDLENDGDISSAELGKVVGSAKGAGGYTYQNNLYGVAAIGSFDPVSFQAWYAYLENVTGLYAFDLAGDFALTDDFSLGLHGQFAGSAIDGSFKDDTSKAADNAIFWAIEASASAFGLDFSAGYLDYSTDKDKASVISFEDQGSFITAGEDLLDYRLFNGENKYWFVTANYGFLEKYNVGVDYVDGENKVKNASGDVEKTDRSEIVGRLGYAYSKKLGFTAWYSHIDEKADGEKDKTDHFRFQAKYSF